jgi:DNA-binding LytR/AlgR family response regulator
MMHCVAVDDEPLALDVLNLYCSKSEGIKLNAWFTNPLEALDYVGREKPDLIFLDIQMPGMSGIEFLKKLDNPPLVVFTTAYEDYALQGYELDVVDYLLKPIPFDRFRKAIEKAQEIHTLLQLRDEKKPEFIFVRSEYQLVKVNLYEIQYIEGLKDYVKIWNGPRPILSHQNLKSIESRLPESDFVRVHKSYIVSEKHVQSFNKNMLIVGGTEIPIGDSYKEQLFARWKKAL